MSFREVIASFLSGGMGNHYSRYGDYTIGADKLSNNVVTFLRQWMESDDPVLRAHTGDEGTIVACAIEEFHIAEAGKDTIKRHNKGERDKIDELHRLADEAEKISKKLKEVEASGEIILTLGRNYSVWPRPPKLSFDEMASGTGIVRSFYVPPRGTHSPCRPNRRAQRSGHVDSFCEAWSLRSCSQNLIPHIPTIGPSRDLLTRTAS
jgi:hypothetical protein